MLARDLGRLTPPARGRAASSPGSSTPGRRPASAGCVQRKLRFGREAEDGLGGHESTASLSTCSSAHSTRAPAACLEPPFAEQLLALSFAGAEVRGSLRGLTDDLQALVSRVEGTERRLWARTSGFDMVKQRCVDLEVRIQSVEQQARMEKTGAAEVQRRQARRMRGCEQGLEDASRQLGKLEAAVHSLQEASSQQETRAAARLAAVEQRQERLERELQRHSLPPSRGSSSRPGERSGAEAPPQGGEGPAGSAATAARLVRQRLASLERRLGRKMESLASTVSILHGRLDLLPQDSVPAASGSVAAAAAAAAALPLPSLLAPDVCEEPPVDLAARPPRPEAPGRSRARAMELRALRKPPTPAAEDAATPAFTAASETAASATEAADVAAGMAASPLPTMQRLCSQAETAPPAAAAAEGEASGPTSCNHNGVSTDEGPKRSSDHRVRVALRDVFYRAGCSPRRPLSEGTDPSQEQAESLHEPVALQGELSNKQTAVDQTDLGADEDVLEMASSQLHG